MLHSFFLKKTKTNIFTNFGRSDFLCFCWGALPLFVLKVTRPSLKVYNYDPPAPSETLLAQDPERLGFLPTFTMC